MVNVLKNKCSFKIYTKQIKNAVAYIADSSRKQMYAAFNIARA